MEYSAEMRIVGIGNPTEMPCTPVRRRIYKVAAKRELKAVFRKTEELSRFENSQNFKMTPQTASNCTKVPSLESGIGYSAP